MNIINEIKEILSQDNHVVKVSEGKKKLSKGKGVKLRYSFSLNDIEEKFTTVENFINHLIEKGFSNPVFKFSKVYGDPATYQNVKTTTVNLSTPPMQNELQTQIPQNTGMQMQPQFLGNPNAGYNPQFLGALVTAERAEDFKEQISDLKEENKDHRSKIRRLEEENHSLRLKNDTSDERTELKIQTALNDKKSVLESEGVQAIAGGLGSLIPHLLPALMGGQPNAAQLGGASPMSPIKQKIVALLANATEDTTSLVGYILQNPSPELIQIINNHIQQTT